VPEHGSPCVARCSFHSQCFMGGRSSSDYGVYQASAALTAFSSTSLALTSILCDSLGLPRSQISTSDFAAWSKRTRACDHPMPPQPAHRVSCSPSRFQYSHVPAQPPILNSSPCYSLLSVLVRLPYTVYLHRNNDTTFVLPCPALFAAPPPGCSKWAQYKPVTVVHVAGVVCTIEVSFRG
jgi:hypothetical protein